MNSQAYQPLASTSSPQNNATSPPSQFSTYLRRWRPYIILVAAASIIALLLPSQPYTALTRAARELGYTGGGNLGDQPTIAVVDTRELVNLMAKVSPHYARRALRLRRQSWVELNETFRSSGSTLSQACMQSLTRIVYLSPGWKRLRVVPWSTSSRKDDIALRMAPRNTSRFPLFPHRRRSILSRPHPRNSDFLLRESRPAPLESSPRFHLCPPSLSALVEPLGMSRSESTPRNGSIYTTHSSAR